MAFKGIVEKVRRFPLAFAGKVRPMNKSERNVLQVKLMALRQQHRDLDIAIATLEDSGTGDQLQLRRLKKMKLQIKDQINHLEADIIPDIIA
ncbi:hypothetical protein BH10PSE7_BH10PSE7_32720 [soil metagenome]